MYVREIHILEYSQVYVFRVHYYMLQIFSKRRYFFMLMTFEYRTGRFLKEIDNFLFLFDNVWQALR